VQEWFIPGFFSIDGVMVVHNVRMVLEYDGSNYHGWQRQKNALAVQQVVEETLEKLYKRKIRVIAAGRTDRGVHAKGQNINFKVQDNPIPVNRLPLAVNSLLPSDIAAVHAEEKPLDFHARYDVKSKVYSYRILNRKYPSPLLRNYSWHVNQPLNIDKMKAAMKYFLGEHDFTSFQASGNCVKNAVRTIQDLHLEKHGDILVFRIKGNGFLYNMVRIIIGTLVEIGLGKIPPNSIPRIIEAKDRNLAGPTAPPNGLCLEHVEY